MIHITDCFRSVQARTMPRSVVTNTILLSAARIEAPLGHGRRLPVPFLRGLQSNWFYMEIIYLSGVAG